MKAKKRLPSKPSSSPKIVRNELLKLNESTSPGPDAIPAKLLKELAPEMSKPLVKIFQTSFVTGCLPFDWRSATITLLFKDGSHASANNYRPVSLTSICCKIMEKIVKKALMQFLEQYHLLSDAPHGFRGGRSCLTNMLFTLERWTKARDEGNVVHAIYIDFKKAFDIVPHQSLLHKLRKAGIRGRLLLWIQGFFLVGAKECRSGFNSPQMLACTIGTPNNLSQPEPLWLLDPKAVSSTLNRGMPRTLRAISCLSVLRSALRPQWRFLSSSTIDPVKKEGSLCPPNIQGQEKIFPAHIESIADSIAKLTLLEVADLNELLIKRLNIKAPSHGMAFMSAAAPQVSPATDTTETEEVEQAATKTAFTVKLVKFDAAKKVALIKEIKALLPDMNLVQAKKFVEAAPGILKKDLSKDEAEAMKKTLEGCGATVEIE
nr:unnamed protein product [Spirometra erinaceieuropaei]